MMSNWTRVCCVANIFIFRLLITSVNLSYSFVIRKHSVANRLGGVVQGLDKVGAARSAQRPSKSLFPSIVEKTRTIANVCVSGTLCTLSSQKSIEGYPFGSYVDYILDEKGWPILLLNEKSQHSQNVLRNKAVSLFCQVPSPQYYGQTSAALGRVTITGDVDTVDKKSATPYKYAFSLVHPYTEEMVDSPKFIFAKVKPQKIYYTSGFGAVAEWVDVAEYERTQPDVLAQEVPSLLPRLNVEKQVELKLMCKHFLRLPQVDSVRLHNIDRLGVDIRATMGEPGRVL